MVEKNLGHGMGGDESASVQVGLTCGGAAPAGIEKGSNPKACRGWPTRPGAKRERVGFLMTPLSTCPYPSVLVVDLDPDRRVCGGVTQLAATLRFIRTCCMCAYVSFPSTPAAERSQGLRATSVLLVDDDAGIRSVVRHYLEDEGASVMEAMDAEQAVLLLTKGYRATVVVTDFIMPGLSGANWLARLRELLPEQKIVVMTGMPPSDPRDAELRDALDAHRISSCIFKPFTRAQLLAHF
jgi:CheY-like chemotaxis protein